MASSTAAVTLTAGFQSYPGITWTSSGTVIEWYTPTLEAITLSGIIRAHIKAGSGATAAVRFEVAVVNGNGTGAVVYGSAASSVSLGGESPYNLAVAGPDISITAGQRLRFRVYAIDPAAGPMTSGTATLYYNSATQDGLGDMAVVLPIVLVESVTAALFAAVPTATATVTAPLTTSIRMAAAPTATATVTAALTALRPIAAVVSTSATVTAPLTTAITLASTVAASATVTAPLLAPVKRTVGVSAYLQLPGSLNQEGFRFYEDNNTESTATAIAAQDTGITRAPGTTARLRVLLDATGDPPSLQYKLRYRKVGDTTWLDV